MFCDLDLKGSDVSFDGEQENMEKMNGIIIQADQSRLKAAKKVFVLKDSQYLTISKRHASQNGCKKAFYQHDSWEQKEQGWHRASEIKKSTHSICIYLDQLFVGKLDISRKLPHIKGPFSLLQIYSRF